MKKELKAYKNVFEPSTIRAVWTLITKKIIKGIESPIKIGKESNIFSALTPENERVILKIYRIQTCDFFSMRKYLAIDPRFKLKKSRKAVVLLWARREFTNLTKAYEAKARVPKPIAVQDNVLVMEFVGEKNKPIPAPRLKDSLPSNPKLFFKSIVREEEKLLRAKIIHGDLSEFNILNYKEKPVLIDFSHAVPLLPLQSLQPLFYRDLNNLERFFSGLIGKKELEKEINKLIKLYKRILK